MMRSWTSHQGGCSLPDGSGVGGTRQAGRQAGWRAGRRAGGWAGGQARAPRQQPSLTTSEWGHPRPPIRRRPASSPPPILSTSPSTHHMRVCTGGPPAASRLATSASIRSTARSRVLLRGRSRRLACSGRLGQGTAAAAGRWGVRPRRRQPQQKQQVMTLGQIQPQYQQYQLQQHHHHRRPAHQQLAHQHHCPPIQQLSAGDMPTVPHLHTPHPTPPPPTPGDLPTCSRAATSSGNCERCWRLTAST